MTFSRIKTDPSKRDKNTSEEKYRSLRVQQRDEGQRARKALSHSANPSSNQFCPLCGMYCVSTVSIKLLLSVKIGEKHIPSPTSHGESAVVGRDTSA